MSLPKAITTKSGDEAIIREAEPAHASALITYLNEVAGESDFLTFGAGGFTKSIEDEERFINESRSAENRLFLIALINTDIAGIITVEASPKERIRHVGVFGMSVRKRYWNRGIGSALLRAVIRWAHEGGVIRKLNLLVQENNHAAIALYTKLGFEREGVIRRDSCIDGQFSDSIAMGLLIDPYDAHPDESRDERR